MTRVVAVRIIDDQVRAEQALADSERLFRLLAENREVEDKPGAVPLPSGRLSVGFSEVDFFYEKERQILHQVSFDIPTGHRVAVVGGDEPQRRKMFAEPRDAGGWKRAPAKGRDHGPHTGVLQVAPAGDGAGDLAAHQAGADEAESDGLHEAEVRSGLTADERGQTQIRF